jgi:protein-tyrosine phosphatase
MVYTSAAQYADAMDNLVWDGYLNARDLGGLPTPLSSTGWTVTGRIARGPRRERLTVAGWVDTRTWGLAAVVDLRCGFEIGPGIGDPYVPTEALAGISLVNAPTEDQGDAEFMRVCAPILDSPEYWAHNWRLQPQLVRGALEAVASSPSGTLVHCSAGRDRTGMISALLLGNAGVTPDAVAADYAASVHAMAAVTQLAPGVEPQTARSREEVDEWMIDKLPIVRDAAAQTQEILDQLSVPSATRAILRAKLIEC